MKLLKIINPPQLLQHTTVEIYNKIADEVYVTILMTAEIRFDWHLHLSFIAAGFKEKSK